MTNDTRQVDVLLMNDVNIFACVSRVVLETFLLWCHLIPALVLRHLDLPVPGGGGAGVEVQCDGHTGVGGGDIHVLPRVVAADDGGRCVPRYSH